VVGVVVVEVVGMVATYDDTAFKMYHSEERSRMTLLVAWRRVIIGQVFFVVCCQC